ncbi:MAG: class I SAM-dependent RNA methyltransferase [Bacillota bacterium]|nr:class I SAM-dependent RNA methyltransferase [Bacillota bacterium]
MDKTKDGLFTGLMASCAFGLEGVLAAEIRALSMEGVSVSDARVTFSGAMDEAMKANMYLRTADRIYLILSQFPVESFDMLFEGVHALRWAEILSSDAAFPVRAKSVHSRLFSVPDCQAIAKKAIVESLKRTYHSDWFPETGPVYTIDVALLNDIATISLDTSGVGLNRRGYRARTAEAPLRENLAAGLILLSGWRGDKPFLDPFCGSGTITIEAALIGTNIAPGLLRNFAIEGWAQAEPRIWAEEREKAKEGIRCEKPAIYASDIDGDVIGIAKENAARAGVDFIRFLQAPVALVKTEGKRGTIVCNPPYGERTGDMKQVHRACKGLGELFTASGDWTCCALSAFPDFERWFGKQADRKRKLYNGNMRCDYYQYYPNLKKNKTI